MNVYDIVLDFMLMDAFDDLSDPPSALQSVIHNGWISSGIKQSVSVCLIVLGYWIMYYRYFTANLF